MKKNKTVKIILILIIITAVIASVLTVYVFAAEKDIRSRTIDYIVSKGYPTESISEISIDHSFLRLFLGFNEWRIFVNFSKEPVITVCLTYRNNEIIFQGVNSEPMMNAEIIIEYSEKFKNGTLL